MGRLLGRETELASIAAALEAARSTGVARAVCLSGPAGIGKTALVEEAEARAPHAGWLVAHVDVHRIRDTLPLAAAHHFKRRSAQRARSMLERWSPMTGKWHGRAVMEIIALVADGHTNRGIARKLFLSERTVESHLAAVFNKLNVSSRTQVAA